jgi:c(7)-type cytochrome triheme protein
MQERSGESGFEQGNRMHHRRLVSLLVTVVCIISVACFLRSTAESSGVKEPAPGAGSKEAPARTTEFQGPTSGDFSRFTHTNAMHRRLPCLLCHRRETNSPRPTRPGRDGHAPCAGCHSAQFASTGSPICTICHTNVQTGTLKPFPPLRSFRIKFDHARHVQMSSVSCATCHQPARRGVAFSIPARTNAHVICFRCHTPQAQSGGRDISSCSTCHQLGSYRRTSEWVRAYSVSFSHAKHTESLRCTECHTVRPGMSQGRQVSAPLPLNHHAPDGAESCRTCHNGKRAFGGDDFSVCKRCHTGKTWHF